MSLRPKNGRVALSILGVYTHLCGMYSFSAVLAMTKELKDVAQKASAQSKKPADVPGVPEPQPGPSTPKTKGVFFYSITRTFPG